MLPQIIFGHEHQPLNEKENFDKINLSEISLNMQDSKILGLHWVGKKVCPGNFIGVVWLGEEDNRVVLRVDSKFENMDYMEMFAKCCENSDVGKKMHGCLDIWTEQALIDIPDVNDFSFMVVVSFLQELNTLCTRHLRRHFHRQRENFVGKVKGKILIGENLRRNIGHAERMFCEYQSISDDILENRILRAALEKSARYLSIYQSQKGAKQYPNLQLWIHACRAHLQSVSVVHIARRDFGKARNRGAFVHYRRPLNLAKAVLCHLGFNPHADIPKNTKTPPYCINSAKLFELYAELQLRKIHPNIKVQESMKNPKDGFAVKVRPDFYVPRSESEQEESAPLIIDAKYKRIDEKPADSDMYQVVAYSQHIGLLRAINKDIDERENVDDIELHLAYPWMEGMQSWPDSDANFTDAFKCKIHLHKIECPVADSSRSETKTE